MKNLLTLIALALFVVPVAMAERESIGIGEIEYVGAEQSSSRHSRSTSGDMRAFADMMTTALVKTKKLDVMERGRMDEVLKEQGLSVYGITSGGYEGEDYNLAGIDYVLTGAITQYGKSDKAMAVKGFSAGGSTWTMSVDIRVLNVHTGGIEIAETVQTKLSGGMAIKTSKFAGGGSSDKSEMVGKLLRQSAMNVTNLIVTSIYPVRIVNINGKQVILNYGDALLSAGDVLEVYSQGESFTDPDTGEVLGMEETLVGTIKVTAAQPKFAKAEIQKDSDPMQKGMIARVTSSKEKKTKTQKKRLF